jgi:TolB protein
MRSEREIHVLSLLRRKLSLSENRPLLSYTRTALKRTILCFLLFLTLSCRKNTVATSPTVDTPVDFRVTDFEAAWSVDGHTIAFVHGDTTIGQTGIWLIDTSGANKRLLYIGVGAYSPSWSPNGQWIAFSDGGQICKIKSNGDSLVQLTVSGSNFYPTWSPDGLWIAYDSDNDSPNGMNFIWKMKVDGSQKTRIAYEPSEGEIRMPNWSKDGSKIAHIRYLVGVFSSEVFTMDNNGTQTVRLTDNASTDYFPRYSPNGTKIAFTSQSQGGQPQIYIMSSDGTNIIKLTSTQGYSCDWSPTGDWIAYTDSRASNGRLWLMRSDGSNKHQLSF